MTVVTSEYVYDNIKLNETRNIVENTLKDYVQKHGNDYRKSMKVKCIAEFLDETKNETKNLITERHNIIGELNKILQSSKGMIKILEYLK